VRRVRRVLELLLQQLLLLLQLSLLLLQFLLQLQVLLESRGTVMGGPPIAWFTIVPPRKVGSY
jgi:hypothetical protein